MPGKVLVDPQRPHALRLRCGTPKAHHLHRVLRDVLAAGRRRVAAGADADGVGHATLGQIARPDGTMQLTVDGYPMYTYVGDSKPGRPRARA